MPTLAGFNGASVVPDVTGALRQGGQAFGAVRQLGRENAADDAAVKAAGGDMDALALLSRLDPNAGQMVGAILQNKDAKAAAELAAQKEKRVREAAMWLQTDPKDRQAALLQMATGLRDAGEDFSHLVQFSQMDPQRQEAEARRIIAMGAGIDQVLKPLFQTGDNLVKQQMGAGAIVEIDGVQYFSNPVFDPASGQSKTNLTPVGGGNPIEVPTGTLEGMANAGRATIVSKNSGLTPEQQVEQKQSESAAGERGKQGSKSRRVYMDEGIAASDGMSSITKAMKLLDDVSTGGVTSTAGLRLKQFLGVESADEGELSGLLGKAVLSQLRSTFGAQFTAAEGQRLEGIEAGFGKNTETNKRLLENAFETLEKAAERGIRAAEAEGDDFTAEEIKRNLEAARAALKEDSGNPTANKRFKFNPATGQLEPAQ